MIDTPLRTDNFLNFSPSTQNGLLSSPATSDITPPHGRVQAIYSHGITTTAQLKDIAILPPFVHKTPTGPVAYNPQLPVFIQTAMYPPMTPQHQHVQTASMADITSTPVSRPRFSSPPLSHHGELLQSPTFPQQRSTSPHDISSHSLVTLV